MAMERDVRNAILGGLAMLLATTSANAAEVKLLTAGAFKQVAVALAPRFEAGLAIHQISEIVVVQGATLVGPLPADIQNETLYAGGIGAAATHQDKAGAFLRLLAGPEGAAVLQAKGMLPPGN